MFGQMVPMGTGSFDVALDMDMLKDVIVDSHLQADKLLTAHADGTMTPGPVAMTPYDSNSPIWVDSSFKGDAAAFSPLSTSGGEESTNFQYLGFGQSPLGARGMSPAGPAYSPSSPNAYSPQALPMKHTHSCAAPCHLGARPCASRW